MYHYFIGLIVRVSKLQQRMDLQYIIDTYDTCNFRTKCTYSTVPHALTANVLHPSRTVVMKKGF
jgi:hypothetical protein